MTQQIYMQTLQALGTTLDFRVVTSRKEEAENIFSFLWDEVHTFENAFTRFSDTSELSRFNARAGKKTFISKNFKQLLMVAKHYAEVTHGSFNPFILPSLQRFGYVHSMVQKGYTAPDYTSRKVVPHTELNIGEDWAIIPENSALDLGGIGKGFLADHLAGLLTDKVSGYCVSVGGDIAVKDAPDISKKWNVHIQSHIDRTKDIAFYQNEEPIFGLATSGLLREKEDIKQEHQIDPFSEATVSGYYVLSTVAAPNTTVADVMASTILLKGVAFAKYLVEQKIIFSVLLQSKDDQLVSFGNGFSKI